MGDKDALRPDLEPSGAWPVRPDDQPVPGVEGRPSPVTEAWAAEAEQRLRVGKEGALPALERRNWAEALEKERADWERNGKSGPVRWSDCGKRNRNGWTGRWTLKASWRSEADGAGQADSRTC